MPKIQKRNNRLLFVIVIILIIAVLSGIYLLRSNNMPTSSKTTNPTINYKPPTKQDAQSVDANKEKIIQQDKNLAAQSATPSSPNAKANLKPIITYADEYQQTVEVGGNVNVVEDGGTCTATFTLGNTKLTKSVAAVRDATTVDCPAMTLDASQFNPKGIYSVTLSYNSSTSSGSSDSKGINVN